MPDLKNDINKRNVVLGRLQDILNNLDAIESTKAENLVDWFVKKSEYYNKIHNKLLFQKYPNNIKRGDIVLVEFGMNIAPELSDDNTGKHFGLIWNQQGQNFIVIPLTKHAQPPSNKLSVNLGIIPGMPNGVITYAKLDAIRSVSIRRLFRIQGLPNGKLSINQQIQDKISNAILKEFVGYNSFYIDKESLKGYNKSVN